MPPEERCASQAAPCHSDRATPRRNSRANSPVPPVATVTPASISAAAPAEVAGAGGGGGFAPMVGGTVKQCAALFASLSIEVDPERVRVEQQIGAGAFATVFRARYATPNAAASELASGTVRTQLVAVKQLTANGMHLPVEAVEQFQREVSLMEQGLAGLLRR